MSRHQSSPPRGSGHRAGHRARRHRAPQRALGRIVQVVCVCTAVALCATLLGPRMVTPHASTPAGHTGPGQSIAYLSPVADTYVSSDMPDAGHGALPYLTVSSVPGHVRTAYLRFDVPADMARRVAHAALVLTRTNHHLAGAVSVHAVNRGPGRSWDEGAMSAATSPAVGRTLATQNTDASTTAVRLDVLHTLRGGTASTFAITSSLVNGFAQFNSREAASSGPVLELSLRNVAPGTSQPPTSSAPTTPPSSGGSTTPGAPASTPTGAPTTSSAPTSPTSPPSSSSSANPGPADGFSLGLSPSQCSLSAILVPSCGRYLGIAPQAHTGTPLGTALPIDESLAHRTVDIVHGYHTNGTLFPTTDEITAARGGMGGTQQRILLENWKPSTSLTWAAVAAGQADATIDDEARYLKANFPYRFFLTIFHEPENDVDPAAGSGRTAADYAAMYRHVVSRLRADGVSNAIFVMNYMGYVNWTAQPWFKDLWPGKEYVDWVATDPYAGYGRAQDLDTLINRPYGNFPGFYTYLQTLDPGVPMMIAEWGVVRDPHDPGAQAAVYAAIQRRLADPNAFPHLKALVYFDQPTSDFNCSPEKSSAAAYAAMTNSMWFHQRISYIR